MHSLVTPDILTSRQRSERMRRIRSRDTAWELDFRRWLWRLGLRYRVHYGRHRIDVAFVGGRLAVFLDSCFWHLCPEHGELPETNRHLWRRKLEGNRARDARTTRSLRREGWAVLRLWSHDFVSNPEAAALRVLHALRRR